MGPQKPLLPPAIGASDPQRPGGTIAEAGDTSLSEAVATLRKRKWILILAAVLGVGYGAYKAYTQPKLYLATSIIEVRNGASNAYRVEGYDYTDDSQTRMNSEALILKSETLMYTVAREMDLANNPDFWGAKGPSPHVSIDDPNVRASTVGTLQGSLQVSLIPRTEMMSISYVGSSAKLSADIVNQVVYEYIQRSFHIPVEQTDMVSNFLADHMDELKSQLERAQDQMMTLERKIGVLGYDPASTHSELQTSLEDLLGAEESAKIVRMTAESRYTMVKNMDPNTIEGSIETTPGTAPGELNGLRAQLAVAQANYAELTAPGGLGPNHPRAKALQDQMAVLSKEINTEQSRLELQAKETYLAAKASEDKIDQELEAKKKEAYDQGNDLVELTLVQREYEQDRTLYEGLKQRLETAKVEAGLDASEVDQVDKALPPVSPTIQSPTRIIVITTLFFLLGGVVIAFLVESLDTGLHNIQEIEQVMEMPSLAIIPRARRASAEQTAGMSAAQRNINVLTQPKSQFTEAFRSLRTSLLLATAGQPPRFILFTSATPSEGKTTAATNLACILAQGEGRVLLVDADLRRPNVHHRFGLRGKLGLTTVLAGTSSFEEAVQHVPELPNLDVLPSGPVPPFPTEMLSSEAMKTLLEKLSKQYAHVVIDSPPILSVTDAAILGRVVDAVVLVVRHGKSSKNVMRRARDLMVRSGAQVAGLVLNAVDVNSPEYYGYYGYSGYSYGSADADTWDTQPSANGAGADGKVKR